MSNYGLAPSATGGLGRTYMYFTGTPTYPFGYGLSYTRFSFSNLRITPQAVSADDTVSASFDVKNTGAAAGSTVAQLYVRSPRIAGVERPIKRLEGFEKTDVLQPGQTQTITMTVAARDLGFWNQPAARREVDDGTYQFELGYDSDNIADSQTVAVTGGLTSHVKYVTVEPPAVVYKPGDTVDLTAKNPWLKDDTNPASEQRNLRVTGDGIVEAVNDDGSFLDLSRASVTYVSSNPNVATVSTRGVMTAVAPGVATLRVTVGGVTGSTVVAVKQPLALSGPPVALPGSSFTETETLVNTGSDTLRSLDLGLTAPSGWTAVPGSSTSVSAVPAGGSAQVTWTVRPPLGAAPGRYGLEASATSETTRGESTVDSSADVALPYQSLAAAFNNAGVSDDANPASGNLDGGGRSYSMQALSAAGLTHSAVVTHDGLNFVWAGAAPGAPDNAVADGQAIPVTGRGTTLGFLGSGDYGTADGVGAIVYTDGSTQPFELTFADWWANRAARGGDILVTSPYVNTPSGKHQQPNNIYYAGVPLASGKTVQDVILPDVSQSPAVNQTAMHIFAVAIG